MGGKFEVEWQANPSNKVSMEEESVSGSFNERHMDIYFSLKDIGKLSIGRGDMASNGSSEVDLSGTTVAGFSELNTGRGFAFYDTTGIAVPADEEERSDVALRYSNTFGGTKLKTAVAYSNPGEWNDYTQINGSASVLFGFGLNLTLAAGTRDMDNMPVNGDDPSFTYGKIGYKTDLISAGSTVFSFDYGVYQNIGTMDTEQEGTLFGIQLVQKLAAYSTELFAAYRNWEVEDNTGAEYEPISIAIAGVRIKF